MTANAPCRTLITGGANWRHCWQIGTAHCSPCNGQHHWASTGNERFAPLVRDLSELLQNEAFRDRPVHVAAAGSGALVVLKLLRSALPDMAPFASLSLLAPSLRVHDRNPRTPLTHLPHHCCVVADEACTVTPWQDTVALARRLPVLPHVLLAQGHDSYWMAQDEATLRPDRFLLKATRMAGAWDLAWADWLQDVDFLNATVSEPLQTNG